MSHPKTQKGMVSPGGREDQFSNFNNTGPERKIGHASYENKVGYPQNMSSIGVPGQVFNLHSVNKCSKNPILGSTVELMPSTDKPNIKRNPSKALSAQDKNALLKEKVSGASFNGANYKQDYNCNNYQQNMQRKSLPLQREFVMNTCLKSSLNKPFPVNNSIMDCISNPNNNMDKTHSMYGKDSSHNTLTKDLIVDFPSERSSKIPDNLLMSSSGTSNSPSSFLKESQSFSLHNKSHVMKNQVLPCFENNPESYSSNSVIIPTFPDIKETKKKLFNTEMPQCINNEDEIDWSRPSSCVRGTVSSVVPHHKSSVGDDTLASVSAPCSPAKPMLQKLEAVDLEEYDYYRKLHRGISKATDNVNIVSKARSEFAKEMWEAIEPSGNPFFVETPIFTFTLPDLSIYSDEFRAFLEKDLIESSTLVSLEGAGRLNWWALIGASQRLWPLATSGDGNCLLHAASLAMWGFHDRLLTLRKALHEFMTRSQFARPLWRRWRWQLSQINKQTGLQFSSEEWACEWANVLHLASCTPRGNKSGSSENGPTTHQIGNQDKMTSNSLLSGPETGCRSSGNVYESLEDIHVLALAHILRRPIIIVADTTLKDVSGFPLAPIPFGGVYLPLECSPQECQRSPLLLTYDAAHFSALVVMDVQQSHQNQSHTHLPAAIPLTDCYHEILPIQFVIDPGEDFQWDQDDSNLHLLQKFTMTNQEKIELLNDYLEVKQIPIPPGYLEEVTQYQDETEYFENCYSPVMEKKFSYSSSESDDGMSYDDSKNRATKQLQNVAKQFGSIGRTMSKRIKKNLGSLSRIGRAGSFRKKDEYAKTCRIGKEGKIIKVSTHQNFILAAQIHNEKRHAYQEEMISNYLSTARKRFEKEQEVFKLKELKSKNIEKDQMEKKVDAEGPIECINHGCNMYGTSLTSYMCSSCHAKQKVDEHEYKCNNTPPTCASSSFTFSKPSEQSQVSPTLSVQKTNENVHNLQQLHKGTDGPQYGAGKSKFYAELDDDSLINVSKIPKTYALSSKHDGTLFLSNSTFYSDASTIPPFNTMKEQATRTSCMGAGNEKDTGAVVKEDLSCCKQQKQLHCDQHQNNAYVSQRN